MRDTRYPSRYVSEVTLPLPHTRTPTFNLVSVGPLIPTFYAASPVVGNGTSMMSVSPTAAGVNHLNSIGGLVNVFNSLPTNYLFNGTILNTWSLAAAAPSGFWSCSTLGYETLIGYLGALTNGNPPNYSKANLVYDKDTNAWTTRSSRPAAGFQNGISVTSQTNNDAMTFGTVAGGLNYSYYYTASSNSWSARTTPPTTTAREDSNCYSVGGQDAIWLTPAGGYKYTHASNAWSLVGGWNTYLNNFVLSTGGLRGRINDVTYFGVRFGAGYFLIYAYNGEYITLMYRDFLQQNRSTSNYGSDKMQMQFSDRTIGIYNV